MSQTVTNEDILENLQELMQLTGEGFVRLEGRMDGLEKRMYSLEQQYSELKVTVDKIAGEQQAQKNDIKEILDRLLAIEKRLPNITELELREMQVKLQALVDWAIQAAKLNHIPLKLPHTAK